MEIEGIMLTIFIYNIIIVFIRDDNLTGFVGYLSCLTFNKMGLKI